MAGKPWEICHYVCDEECPNLDLISKAILFPQLLEPSEIKIVEKLCNNCERCQEEKRSSPRIRRPLRVSIASQESFRNARGSLLNVSSTGALVELDNWVDFNIFEKITLQFRKSDQISAGKKDTFDNRLCICKRLIKEKRQIGVMFIDEKPIN